LTTELLHPALDIDHAVIGSASTEPSVQDCKIESSSVSSANGTGGESDAHAINSTSADIRAKIRERKPSKIIFKDYCVDPVRCLLFSFHIKLA